MIAPNMQQTESSWTRPQRSLITALCCGTLSAFLMRTGLLSFCFLVPLGFISVVYSGANAWISWGAAVISNILLTLVLYFSSGSESLGTGILYFTVLSFGFTWIMNGIGARRGRSLYRFIIASIAGAITLLLVYYDFGNGAGFRDLLRAQIELITSKYISAGGYDDTQRSLIENALTPDNILEFITMLMLKGGALVSCFFLFFFSRQVSAVLARFIRGQRPPLPLSAFHAPVRTIWILSTCLGAVIIFHRLNIFIPEIVAWNILIICAIIFLAQGAGIVLYKVRFSSQLGRLGIVLLFCVIVFTPGVNAMTLGILILLGILENWLPLRMSKNNSASTPGPFN